MTDNPLILTGWQITRAEWEVQRSRFPALNEAGGAWQ